MVCGLSPETFTDFILQRNRWAQGMAQIFILKNPLFKKGLTIPQRLCYLNSCMFWFFGLARMVYLLAPLFYLFFGLRVYNASVSQVLAFTVPHLVCSTMLSTYLFGKVRSPFFSEVYETVQSVYNLPAVISAIMQPRKPTFKVTPKNRSLDSDFLSPLAYPFYVLLLLFAVSLVAAAWRWNLYPVYRDLVMLTAVWSVYHIFILFLCLGIVWERRQIRKRHRMPVRERVMIEKEDGDVVAVDLVDISDEGIGLRADVSAGLASGTTVRMTSIDGKYSFLVSIINSFGPASRPFYGGRFIIEDEQSWLNITKYMYGSSERWDEFWKHRRTQVPRFWVHLRVLLDLAIDGFYGNMKGSYASMKIFWKEQWYRYKNRIPASAEEV